MSKYKVEISGINTSDIEVLSQSKMEELFNIIRDDKSSKEMINEARDILVNGNLRLVLSIIKGVNKKQENLDDLFQIGCVGLLKAIDNFDLSYGVKFSTYCVPMVLGEVKRYLRDNSTIRVSRSIKDVAVKVLKLKDKLTIEKGYEPSNRELADILEIDEKDIVNAMESLIQPISIFEPIYNDGGDTIYLFDQLEDKSNSSDLDMKLALRDAISALSEKEQYILDQRFIMGRTQSEIASELNISQAQISRLEKSAIDTVRKRI